MMSDEAMNPNEALLRKGTAGCPLLPSWRSSVPDPIRGYWFGGEELLFGDGRPVSAGCTLTVDGPLYLCEHGLHFSRHPFDALEFAPGPFLWQVEAVGGVLEGENKICTTARKHLAQIDATPLLRAFARWCAFKAAYRWDCPAIVREFLLTGDAGLQEAAGNLARKGMRIVPGSAVYAVYAAWIATRHTTQASVDTAWGTARYARMSAGNTNDTVGYLTEHEAQRADFLARVEAAFAGDWERACVVGRAP